MDLKSIRKKFTPGLNQFLLKVFGIIFILFIEKLFFPSASALVQYNILGRTSTIIVILAAVIFCIMERRKLLRIKKDQIRLKRFLVFFPIHMFFIGLFIALKYFIILNAEIDRGYFYWLVAFRYLLPFLGVVFLGLALFENKFIKKFYKSIIISFILSIVFFAFSMFFKKYWFFVSRQVATIIYFILSITFKDSFINLSNTYAPVVGTSKFFGRIESPCAGIESLSLFSLLYMLAVILDRKEIKFSKAVIAGLFGFVGIFFVNIFRIYLIFLVGIFYNSKLAIHYFHTNLGWILFVFYFAVYWVLIYGYIRNRKLFKNKFKKI